MIKVFNIVKRQRYTVIYYKYHIKKKDGKLYSVTKEVWYNNDDQIALEKAIKNFKSRGYIEVERF